SVAGQKSRRSHDSRCAARPPHSQSTARMYTGHDVARRRGDPTITAVPRIWRLYAAGGALLGLGVCTLTASGQSLAWPERVLLFGPLVVVPLAMAVLVASDVDGLDASIRSIALRVHPVAAACAVASLLMDQGKRAAVLAAGWSADTLVIALLG